MIPAQGSIDPWNDRNLSSAVNHLKPCERDNSPSRQTWMTKAIYLTLELDVGLSFFEEDNFIHEFLMAAAVSIEARR